MAGRIGEEQVELVKSRVRIRRIKRIRLMGIAMIVPSSSYGR